MATRHYADGEEATAAVAAAIASARHEVLVETYILRDDRIGMALVDLLRAAVARGVRCCLLADAVGSWGARRAFWRALTDAGVSVRRFHPLSLDLINSFRRDHRKLVIVDRSVAFTGGMNIGAEYGSSLARERRTRWWRRLRTLDAEHPDTFRDVLIRLDGPIAAQLASVFAEGWHRAGGGALPALEAVTWAEDGGDYHGAPVPVPLRTVTAESRADALILDARPGRGQPETIAVLAAALGAARVRAWITTPYFAPPTAALRLMADAVRRGVDVRLLLPGISDVPVMTWAAHGAYSVLLASGVRIYEYQPAVLHAKSLVVDDTVSIVGSANLDYRSFWFNAECSVLVLDAVLTGAVAQAFRDDLADAREVTRAEWQRVPWWVKVRGRVVRLGRWAL
ncbi:MAG: phospholipase D-like domain-containing protein [Gemmatimonadaceae bacterium]|nr:phospholipase D-like domain-containing protein [Gemmatimonadaceae bacterium]